MEFASSLPSDMERLLLHLEEHARARDDE
jgi:hypothetical protein